MQVVADLDIFFKLEYAFQHNLHAHIPYHSTVVSYILFQVIYNHRHRLDDRV